MSAEEAHQAEEGEQLLREKLSDTVGDDGQAASTASVANDPAAIVSGEAAGVSEVVSAEAATADAYMLPDELEGDDAEAAAAPETTAPGPAQLDAAAAAEVGKACDEGAAGKAKDVDMRSADAPADDSLTVDLPVADPSRLQTPAVDAPSASAPVVDLPVVDSPAPAAQVVDTSMGDVSADAAVTDSAPADVSVASASLAEATGSQPLASNLSSMDAPKVDVPAGESPSDAGMAKLPASEVPVDEVPGADAKADDAGAGKPSPDIQATPTSGSLPSGVQADGAAPSPKDAALGVADPTPTPQTSPEAATASPAPAEAPLPTPKATAAVPADMVAEDLVDDIVPFVSYEDHGDKKSLFSKDGRWILPSREQFPAVFCALRVLVHLEALETHVDIFCLSPEIITEFLREDMEFGKTLVRWDDSNDSSDAKIGGVRRIVVAVNGGMPPSSIGSVFVSEGLSVRAEIDAFTDTSDDVDPDRIAALAKCLRESPDNDAIVFELPQFWIIADKDFRAKTASIGLYPGSYWMTFLKSWGALATAEIFFRTVKRQSSEPMVHLVVKFRNRESLKMCFTFLYDRYLVHPKQKNQIRPTWCRLAKFQDFQAAAKSTKMPKGRAKAAPKARPGTTPAVKQAGGGAISGEAIGPIPTPVTKRPLQPTSKAVPAAPQASELAAEGATPGIRPKGPPIAKQPPLSGSVAAASATTPKASSTVVKVDDADGAGGEAQASVGSSEQDRKLTPAEAMDGLSGRQREAFQMVMTRMERLERENQELMQILLQMQTLLQQQQQRNAKLTQMAGYSASGVDREQPLRLPAHPALQQAQHRAQQVAPAPAPPAGGAGAQSAGLLPGLNHSSAAPQGPQVAPQTPMPLASQPPSSGANIAATPTPAAALAPMTPGSEAVKRKAPEEAAGEGLDEGGQAGENAEDGTAGEPAPWKKQRRRQRRPRAGNVASVGAAAAAAGSPVAGAPMATGGVAMVAPAEASDQSGVGLAAYHNALLGV